MVLKRQADFVTKILTLHNDHRKKHGAEPLQWSNELQKAATDHAIYLASKRNHETQLGLNSGLEPKPSVPWGQNLYEYSGPNSESLETEGDVTELAVDQAVESWYGEVEEYKWNYPGLTGLSFSQLVWRGTRKVGLGVGIAKGGKVGAESIVVVAFYDPCGNFRGDFTTNVLKKSQSPTKKIDGIKNMTAKSDLEENQSQSQSTRMKPGWKK